MSVVLFVVAAAMLAGTPSEAGANIGAGLMSMAALVLLVLGVVIAGVGIVRWLRSRR